MRTFKFLIKTATEVMLNLFIGILAILAIGVIIGGVYSAIKEIVR
jgi:hypothetical protein